MWSPRDMQSLRVEYERSAGREDGRGARIFAVVAPAARLAGVVVVASALRCTAREPPAPSSSPVDVRGVRAGPRRPPRDNTFSVRENFFLPA